jgi:hypothetical protein
VIKIHKEEPMNLRRRRNLGLLLKQGLSWLFKFDEKCNEELKTHSPIEFQIKKRINSDLRGDYSVSNMHGVNLKKCLVKPFLRIFQNTVPDGSKTIELYVVLLEDPINDSGYQIVYDPDVQRFGLSTTDIKTGPIFLGHYGNFLETLKMM